LLFKTFKSFKLYNPFYITGECTHVSINIGHLQVFLNCCGTAETDETFIHDTIRELPITSGHMGA
jgi:hypothetical protein